MHHALSLRLLLVAAALTLTLTAKARSEGAANEKGKQEKITLEGSVTTPDGQPAAGVSVKAGDGPHALLAKTDGAGRFSLVMPRNSLQGFMLTASDGDKHITQQMVMQELGPDESPKLISLYLKAARIVEVIAVDQQGSPVVGAQVNVVRSYHSMASVQTDEAGRAQLAVPAGVELQFVIAAKPGDGVGYQLYRDSRQPTSDPYHLPQDHAEPLTLKLEPARALTVHVENHEGAPIAGVEVTPWYIMQPKRGGMANLGSLWSVTTNEQGDATFGAIPVKLEQGIVFWTRKEGLVAPRRTMLNPEDASERLTAKLLPLTPVSGRVVREDGSPAAGVSVVAAGDNGDMDDYRGAVETDDEGRFRLEVNPDCYCMFEARDGQTASPGVCRIVQLDEPIDDLELKLGPAANVTGRVTAGGKPAAKRYVSLYLKPRPEYYELPVDEQLLKRETLHAVSPRLIQSASTDAEGRYQFTAAPGDYSLIVNNLDDPPQFTITDQEDVEHELALNLPPEGEFTGRVVLADKPDEGVAEVVVSGHSLGMRARRVHATTDSEGRFKHQVPGAPAVLGAFNEDKSLGAIERVAGDLKDVTIALSPTATASAVVVDEETGEPAGDREITAYIRIGEENGPFMQGFPVSAKTDADGRVTLTGLVVGAKYDLNVVSQVDAGGRARSWQTLGKAEPQAAEELSLGELRIPKPYRPPTVDDDIERAYGHKDPEARLKQLLNDAKLGYYHVLVVAADPKGAAGRRYFEICHFSMDGPEERPDKLHEFLVLAVDPNRGSDLLAEYKLPTPTEKDEAAFAILNADGAIVAKASSDDLSKQGKLNAKLLGEFLENRETPLPNARRLLADAMEQAKQEDKRILVQVGGPGCGWCVVLARYLDEQKPLIGKDYLHVKIDSRMPEAQELVDELREKKEGGIPWMVILDADGKELITSDAESGNIGHPGEPESQKHWLKMLTSTRQRLTDDDLAALMKPLAEKK